MKPKLININQAAELLSCHPKTVRRLVDEGRLQACKIRNGLRISVESLDRYIAGQILKFQTQNNEFDGEI